VSQRRHERALLHEQSQEQLTIVHLASTWAASESAVIVRVHGLGFDEMHRGDLLEADRSPSYVR